MQYKSHTTDGNTHIGAHTTDGNAHIGAHTTNGDSNRKSDFFTYTNTTVTTPHGGRTIRKLLWL